MKFMWLWSGKSEENKFISFSTHNEVCESSEVWSFQDSLHQEYGFQLSIEEQQVSPENRYFCKKIHVLSTQKAMLLVQSNWPLLSHVQFSI